VIRQSVLLDTNVWSYLVDADSVETVRLVARRNETDIVASPAVAYEMLRISDPVMRSAL
jgi:predicted nucleic acid-binding protein